jgi:hypothetical protein
VGVIAVTSFLDPLIDPIGQMWGLPSGSLTTLISLFLILSVSIGIVRNSGNNNYGYISFIMGIFIASILGMVSWIIFLFVMIAVFIVYKYEVK